MEHIPWKLAASSSADHGYRFRGTSRRSLRHSGSSHFASPVLTPAVIGAKLGFDVGELVALNRPAYGGGLQTRARLEENTMLALPGTGAGWPGAGRRGTKRGRGRPKGGGAIW